MLHKELTEEIIFAFYKVYNTLGYGFLERVFKNSLYIELIDLGLKCEVEKPIEVYYNNRNVGVFFADIVVEDKVILELKAIDKLVKENEYQLLNYLKASEYEVGLLLNFGKEPEIKRMIFTNDRKELKILQK